MGGGVVGGAELSGSVKKENLRQKSFFQKMFNKVLKT